VDHPVRRHILASLAALAGAAGAAMATTVVVMTTLPSATAGMLLAAPLLMLILSPVFFVVASLVAIPVLVVLGLPAHLLLQKMRWTSVWAYAAAATAFRLAYGASQGAAARVAP
jgi:hypothetical protein